jgi:Ca2+-binding EF-hand superfamily protein
VAKRLFLKFDQDQSGYLSEDEIPNLLRETYNMMGMEYTPTKEDTASWMKMTDSDGDGKVTLEDYERLIITSL